MNPKSAAENPSASSEDGAGTSDRKPVPTVLESDGNS
jgi:hypothetical protein